jgi:hypothetical protein
MRKVVLITTRDYPYRRDILTSFEQVSGISVYEECISSLGMFSEDELNRLNEKVTEGKSLDVLIKRKKIGNLYKDEKAEWTNNTDENIGWTFNDYKSNDVPLLRRKNDAVTFYILPCTGTHYIGDTEQDTLLRQAYTSNCINLICKCENIMRKNILVIIHSRDTGITGGDMESRVIKCGEQKKGAPLEDIANSGHLYLYHHTVGHAIYDKIIAPLCTGNENSSTICELDYFFPKDVVGWWDKLSILNDNSIEY